MVAADFLRDPQVRHWLDGVEPAWTLLSFESLQALRQEPSAVHTAIQIANNLMPTRPPGQRWRETHSFYCDRQPSAAAFL